MVTSELFHVHCGEFTVARDKVKKTWVPRAQHRLVQRSKRQGVFTWRRPARDHPGNRFHSQQFLARGEGIVRF